MAENSARFGFPFLQAGQAQKEIMHNEALTAIDALIHPVILDINVDDPPAGAEPGDAWIIGVSPTAAWAGRAGMIASWSAGGWRFVQPVTGMMAWLLPVGVWARYAGSEWIVGDLAVSSISVDGEQVIGGRGVAIANPAGGLTIDNEARSTILAILGALRDHGLIAT